MPRTVIVVPMYNCESYITAALQSVVEQSIQDWVCILVNDGSTDSTRDLAARFVETDDRFILIDQENKGAAAARNNAIKLAMLNPEWEYLTLLDGDDIWRWNKLAKQLNYLDEHPETSMVCSNYTLMQDTKFGKIIKCPAVVTRDELFLENYVGTASNPMMRRRGLEKANIDGYYFNEKLKRCDDHEFWIRFKTFSGGNLAFIQDSLFYYRITPSSLQSNVRGQFTEWHLMIDIVRQYDSYLVGRLRRLAKAYQCKTVAIRAMRNKQWKLMFKYLIEAINSDFRIVPLFLYDKYKMRQLNASVS